MQSTFDLRSFSEGGIALRAFNEGGHPDNESQHKEKILRPF